MAWNESGGDGNKKPDHDPWRGGGGRNQGPPDFDEVLKQVRDKVKELLGGQPRRRQTGRSGSSGSSNASGLGLILILIVLALSLLAFNGFYRVEQAEQAVVLRFGKFHALKTAGLRWNPPLIDEILKINTLEISSYGHDATMLTEDQNIVRVQLEVQYRVSDARAYFLEINNAEKALRQATESALRHVVGESEMDRVITEGRFELAQSAKTRLQTYLDSYNAGLRVTKVNMEDAHPPSQVKDAFDDVIKAKEDQVRKQNEGDTYANRRIPEAQGKSQRLLEEAQAYKIEVIAQANGEARRFSQVLFEYQKAPEVTRERLYIESVEKVLANSSKIVMDANSSNNMTYLPLDRILQGQGLASQPKAPSANQRSSQQSSNVDPDERRRRQPATQNSQRTPYQGGNYQLKSYLNQGER